MLNLIRLGLNSTRRVNSKILLRNFSRAVQLNTPRNPTNRLQTAIPVSSGYFLLPSIRYQSYSAAMYKKFHSSNKMNYPIENVQLRWNYTASEIQKRADELIEMAKEVYDEVGKLNDAEVTHDNVCNVSIDCPPEAIEPSN